LEYWKAAKRFPVRTIEPVTSCVDTHNASTGPESSGT
jgi:hypothetical protein